MIITDSKIFLTSSNTFGIFIAIYVYVASQ